MSNVIGSSAQCRPGLRIVVFLTGLLALLALSAAQAALNARVDRPRVADGESLVLTIVASGQRDTEPDTAKLEADFEILGMSSGSQFSVTNGRAEARTTWRLTLLPRRTGTLVIPPLEVGGEQTAPIEIEVGAAAGAGTGGSPDVFVETAVDTDTPYVQGQVIYSVRLHHAVELVSGRLDVPLPEDVLARQLGEDQRGHQERDGRRYAVIERRFALFPQASGPLSLPAPVFDGQVRERRSTRPDAFGRIFGSDPFGDLFTTGKRIRARGEPRELQVRGVPDGARGKGWLPARSVSISDTWSPEDLEVRVGEPVTRTITLTAGGLLGSQLPDVVIDAPEGIKTYPDPARTSDRVSQSGVTGERILKIAYVPDQEGSFSLPALDVWWWDTRDDTARRVSLPERVLTVLPASARERGGVSEPGPAPKPVDLEAGVEDPSGSPAGGPGRSGVPVWWLVVPVLLWLGTLLLWWRDRRSGLTVHRADSPSPATGGLEGAARRRFREACRTGDAAGARRALLEWAGSHWPDDPPAGLSAVAVRLPDADCRQALKDLDRLLYGQGAGTWSGVGLARCLDSVPGAASRNTRPGPLPDLYPRAGE